MKELDRNFIGIGEMRGFKFTQKRATDKAFLYEVDMGSVTYYEVFKMRINEWHNNISYPTSKGFGEWAWSYRNYETAINKFKQLN